MNGHFRSLLLVLGVAILASGCCCFDAGCTGGFGYGFGGGCGGCSSCSSYNEPACGCAGPCGCEPACGIDPSCGCEPGCGIAAGGCGCMEPACGFEPVCGIEPNCGVGGFEATCGIEPSCGLDPSCGCEPACGCGGEPSCGCGGGYGGGGVGCWGWRDDIWAKRAGWKECGPLLRPWFGLGWGGCGCGSCGDSGCGEMYVDEWISDPPACCDPCPRGSCGCNQCARTHVGQKVRSNVQRYFARRKQDWINSGFMCDTSRCRTHAPRHGNNCDCSECAQYRGGRRGGSEFARKQTQTPDTAPHGKSVGNVIQAAFTR